MSKHTPGPWKVIGKGSECRIEANRKGPAHMVICERVNGYRFGTDFSDYSQLEANAHLIAQAPALLADLIDAAAQLRKYETLHRAKGTPDSLEKADVNAALAARFEATIAAAVGGAE